MTTPHVDANRLSLDEIRHLIDTHFPQVHEGSGQLTIEHIASRRARVRMAADPRMLRPGGTVSGPMMFKLADFAVYVAILATLGDGALQAVTTNLTINFLTRPEPADLVAEVDLLKVGRRLAVAEVRLTSDGRHELVAHATATYALPGPSIAVT